MALRPASGSSIVLAAALLLLPVRPVNADSGPSVARISVADGSVSLVSGGESEGAVLNAPLTAPARLATAAGSRAEVEFDGSSLVRVSHDAAVRFASLEPRHRTLELERGTIQLRLFASAAGYRVDAPLLSVVPQDAGSYRIAAGADQTEVTVREGTAQIVSGAGTQTLDAGETLVAGGPPSHPSIRVVEAASTQDEFDRFNDARDALAQSALDSGELSPDYSSGNLDAYGDWMYYQPYGLIWVPAVAGGWAPYRNGRWVWLNPYGWTWVGAEPWGWAPYHYGRWFRNQGLGGWAWVPGAHAPWQPALVGFVGNRPPPKGRPFTTAGWVPLAPGEAFRPHAAGSVGSSGMAFPAP